MTTTVEYTSHARRRAFWSAAGLSLWTVLVAIARPPDWRLAWPLVVFDLFLLVNTFYSIRTFATLIPIRFGQAVFDLAMASCIVLNPLAFNYPMHFALLNLLLFILASFKYILAIRIIGLSETLYRKILLDMLGVAVIFAVVVAMWRGYVFPAAVLGTIAFVGANIYILWINPVYRISGDAPVLLSQSEG